MKKFEFHLKILDSAWLMADFLLASVDDTPHLKNETWETSWFDESQLRGFSRYQKKLIKLLLGVKNFAEVVQQYPVKFPTVKI